MPLTATLLGVHDGNAIVQARTPDGKQGILAYAIDRKREPEVIWSSTIGETQGVTHPAEPGDGSSVEPDNATGELNPSLGDSRTNGALVSCMANERVFAWVWADINTSKANVAVVDLSTRTVIANIDTAASSIGSPMCSENRTSAIAELPDDESVPFGLVTMQLSEAGEFKNVATKLAMAQAAGPSQFDRDVRSSASAWRLTNKMSEGSYPQLDSSDSTSEFNEPEGPVVVVSIDGITSVISGVSGESSVSIVGRDILVSHFGSADNTVIEWDS